MPKATSYIQLSKSALQNNIDFFKNLLPQGCQFSAVVKGNAYGHSIPHFAPLAQECGVNHFSVFSANEAEELLESLQKPAEIVIMGFVADQDLEWAIANDIQFFVFDQLRLEAAQKAANHLGKKARIHIEFDTGLNRTGFTKGELKVALNFINNHRKNFFIEGACTHFAGAESIANHVRIKNQIKKYHKMVALLEAQNLSPKRMHTACSAAVMSYPQTRMDMVRVGIMQYGFWPSRETFINYLAKKKDKQDPLERVISWKSSVMTLHRVRPGEFIGYGTSFMAESDLTIAIIPVGYSEGYSRALSNQGRVLINGQRVGVLGVVNMNMLAVNVTSLAEVQPGDEAVLIGSQEELSISVASFSELSTQLNYELLTRLPQDIPRIITQ